MTRLELKVLSKTQIKGKIGVLFLCSLSMAIINGLVAYIPIVGAIVSGIIAIGFLLSTSIIYLNLVNGKNVEIGDIFSGFNNFWRAFVLSFLASIFIIFWLLIFFIPGIIKIYAYSMAFYILAENPEMSALEALDESERLMYGHKMEFFVLQISFFWWILLSSITMGIAGIYVVPYILTTNVNFYKSIKTPIIDL